MEDNISYHEHPPSRYAHVICNTWWRVIPVCVCVKWCVSAGGPPVWRVQLPPCTEVVARASGDYIAVPIKKCLTLLMQLGGVAFLYHPCAPLDQIGRLRDVARACLWKHIITPYPLLSPKQVYIALVRLLLFILTLVSRLPLSRGGAYTT